jgi:hypothetical protein
MKVSGVPGGDRVCWGYGGQGRLGEAASRCRTGSELQPDEFQPRTEANGGERSLAKATGRTGAMAGWVGWGEAASRRRTRSELQPGELQRRLLEARMQWCTSTVPPPPRKDDIGVLAQSRKAGSSRRSRLSLRGRRLTASGSAGLARGGRTSTERGGGDSMREEDLHRVIVHAQLGRRRRHTRWAGGSGRLHPR